MTRATRFATGAALAVALWTLLILDILPLPLVSYQAKHEILPAVRSAVKGTPREYVVLLVLMQSLYLSTHKQLPWWVLVSTGSYLLYEMGMGLWNFNDVPKAYDDLMIDIKNAKDYLGARGVQIE